MPIFKIVGGLSLIVSTLVIYLESQRYEKKKLIQINAFISLIEYTKDKIESLLMPIDQILRDCDVRLMSECGVSQDKITDLRALFDNTVFYLDGECIELIDKFTDGFGSYYKAEQVRMCEYYINELKKKRDVLKEKIDKEKKLQFAICISISLSLVLLLI